LAHNTDAPTTQGGSPDPADIRTSYVRAVAGYDDHFKRELVEQISTAIFEASITTDAKACALRTGESTDALVTVLGFVLAMRPEAKVPSQLRVPTEEIGKRLLRDVKAFRETHPDFDRSLFHGIDVGGRA
jgi:hypothetical protein